MSRVQFVWRSESSNSFDFFKNYPNCLPCCVCTSDKRKISFFVACDPQDPDYLQSISTLIDEMAKEGRLFFELQSGTSVNINNYQIKAVGEEAGLVAESMY